jgi:hypothetical protein
VVGVATAALFLAYLPFAEVNAMLAPLAAASGTPAAQAGWFSTGYALALAVTVLPGGALAGRFGPRRVTAAGLSLIASAAPVLLAWLALPAAGRPLILAAELTAGAGGGLVLSATLAMITIAVADPAGRARALGVWSAGLVAGLGAGPFLAAAVLAVAPTALLLVPSAVLAAGTAVLVLRLPDRRAARAPLRLDVLGSRTVVAAAVTGAATLFGIVGVVAVVGVRLSASGTGPIGVAAVLLALFAVNAVVSVTAARLTRRVGARAVLVGGLVLAAAGVALVPGALLAGLALLGAGGRAATAVAAAVAVGGLDPVRAGSAGALTNAIRQVGAACAPATLGALSTVSAVLPVLVPAALLAGAALTAAVLLTEGA